MAAEKDPGNFEFVNVNKPKRNNRKNNTTHRNNKGQPGVLNEPGTSLFPMGASSNVSFAPGARLHTLSTASISENDEKQPGGLEFHPMAAAVATNHPSPTEFYLPSGNKMGKLPERELEHFKGSRNSDITNFFLQELRSGKIPSNLDKEWVQGVPRYGELLRQAIDVFLPEIRQSIRNPQDYSEMVKDIEEYVRIKHANQYNTMMDRHRSVLKRGGKRYSKRHSKRHSKRRQKKTRRTRR